MSSIDRPFGPENVNVAASPEDAGAAAGAAAARAVRSAIEERGSARVIFASAPSQEDTLRALTGAEGIDWSRVTSLHLDEYRNIDPAHAAAFGQWLSDRLPAAAQQGLQRIETDGSAEAEIERYSQLLARAPIDLVCLGIGVNGHIAFNEPGDTDFGAGELLREVPLAPASREQQVDDGLFAATSEVPEHALSMTVPAILRGRELVCTVVGASKASAVAATLMGPIDSNLPASALRTHDRVGLFLDEAAAADLPRDVPRTRVPHG